MIFGVLVGSVGLSATRVTQHCLVYMLTCKFYVPSRLSKTTNCVQFGGNCMHGLSSLGKFSACLPHCTELLTREKHLGAIEMADGSCQYET